MTVVKDSVLPPKYMGDGSQLTLLNGTDTVTVTGAVDAAELGVDGTTVTVAVVMPAGDR